MKRKHITKRLSYTQEFRFLLSAESNRATQVVWPEKTLRKFSQTPRLGKEEGVFGHSVLPSRARQRATLRGLPWGLHHNPSGENDRCETKPRCVPLPPLAQHSWSQTARGEKGRLAGIWTPDLWTPLRVPSAARLEKKGPFHSAPTIPRPLGQKINNLAGGGPGTAPRFT